MNRNILVGLGVVLVLGLATVGAGVLRSQRSHDEVITRQERVGALVRDGANPIDAACAIYGVQHSMACVIRGLRRGEDIRR